MATNSINILITGKDQFSPKAQKAQRSAKGLGGAMGSLKKRALGVASGFILAQASIAGVQKLFTSTLGAAMKFEFQLAQIRALTGATRKDTDLLSGAIKQMAREMPKSPEELGAAAYFILSSGIEDAAEAAGVLEIAAKASTIGLGETEKVADALTTVINAYGLSAGDAAHVTDVMIEAVKQGKAEASAFAGVLGRVVPLASQMGISFEEVSANLATFTRLGVSAEEAATGLRAVMNALINPTDQTRATMEELGLSVEGLRKQIKEKGLLAALDSMMTATGGNEEALAKLFPNIRALTSVLGTAGVQLEDYKDILTATENATGNLDEGFGIISETTQFKLQTALSDLNVSMMELGEQGLPLVTASAAALTTTLEGLNAVIKVLDFATDVTAWGKAAEDTAKDVLGLGESISFTAEASRLMSKELGNTGVASQRTEDRLAQLGMKAEAAGLAAGDFGATSAIAAVEVATLEGAVTNLRASLDALIGAQQENMATLSDLAGVRTQEQVALEIQINALALEKNAALQAEIGQSSLGGATESTTDALQKQVGALQNLAASMVPQALNNEIMALDRELKVLQLGRMEIEAQVNARNRLAQAQLAMANVANLPALAKQKKLELDRAKILATVGGDVEKLTDAQKDQVKSIDDQIRAIQSSINVRTLEAELTNLQAEASDTNREALQRELNEIINQIGATQDLKGQRELYIQTLIPLELLQDIAALERQRTALGNSETGARNAGGAVQSLSSIIGDQIGTLQLQRTNIDLVTEGWKLQGEAMLGLPTMEDVRRAGFENMKKMILMMLQASLFAAMSNLDIGLVNQIASQMAQIGSIKFAAHGFHGDVNSPTMFIAGEAGRERVDITPGGGSPGGGGFTLIIQAETIIGGEEAGEQLAELVAPHIREMMSG